MFLFGRYVSLIFVWISVFGIVLIETFGTEPMCCWWEAIQLAMIELDTEQISRTAMLGVKDYSYRTWSLSVTPASSMATTRAMLSCAFLGYGKEKGGNLSKTPRRWAQEIVLQE